MYLEPLNDFISLHVLELLDLYLASRGKPQVSQETLWLQAGLPDTHHGWIHTGTMKDGPLGFIRGELDLQDL